MCKKTRDNEEITIHSDSTKKFRISTLYSCEDVAEAILFLINSKINHLPDWGGAKCPFNIVGSEEIDNLKLAKLMQKSK